MKKRKLEEINRESKKTKITKNRKTKICEFFSENYVSEVDCNFREIQ